MQHAGILLEEAGFPRLLLYLTKLEDIVEARNYSWGSVVLAFLYRELCNATNKGKAAIGGALQLLQIWAWSRIIPLCPGLGAERVYMDQIQTEHNRLLPAAPYGATWNCEHTFTRTVRTTVRVIRDILDEMQSDQMSLWLTQLILTPNCGDHHVLNILCNSGNASSQTGPSPIRDEAKYSRSSRYSGHESASDLP
ncbi:UNVERIFIED_CONTAM: protein MAINTENANCE OF MERISTEMS [Sesamum radiatum]|uniref:Protein MAINTENANCE OF MERISTEMS n=1 Tax=Sesamum radiatum TaxID=300843 RepID=A0AAW2PGK9_SESRA